MHRLWAYMAACGYQAVTVDLDPVLVSDAWDHFPLIIAAVGRDGEDRGPQNCSRLAGMVWDAAEAEAAAGRLTLDGPVQVRCAPVGTRPQRVGDAWRGAIA